MGVSIVVNLIFATFKKNPEKVFGCIVVSKNLYQTK